MTGTEIAERRERAGLTAAHVAQAIGISRVQLSRVENGRCVSPKVIRRAAIYLRHVEIAQREAAKVLAP